MKAIPTEWSGLSSYGESGAVLQPTQEGARLRLIGSAGVLVIDGARVDANTGYYEGVKAFVALPGHVAMHLPYQPPESTLLDTHLPLDPDHQGARTTPGTFRLACLGGGVVSAARGLLMEYMPESAVAQAE